MGKFSDKKHEQANDALLNTVTENDKIESLKEVLNLLSQIYDGNTKLAAVIDARITAALGEQGAITSAISAAITAGIGEGGAIETWGDGRYTKKTE
jgi:F0F1-type ATP synthase delta subunit